MGFSGVDGCKDPVSCTPNPPNASLRSGAKERPHDLPHPMKLLREISLSAQERAKRPSPHEHATGTADRECDLCNGYRQRFEMEFTNDERMPELMKTLRLLKLIKGE